MPAADGPPPVPPALSIPAESVFDLSELPAMALPAAPGAWVPRCSPATAPNEIVVCAPDPDAQRLAGAGGLHGFLPPEAQGPPRAAWKLGDTLEMDLHVEAQALPSGLVSNRLMMGVKIAF